VIGAVPHRRLRATVLRATVLCVAVLWTIACGESRADSRRDTAPGMRPPRGGMERLRGQADDSTADIPTITVRNAVQSLGFAVGRDLGAYRIVSDTATLASGAVVGSIVTTSAAPKTAVIEPTHDRGVCSPYTETLVPSVDGGVGNAVVWLVGVTHGPPPRGPRRVALSLDHCRLEPRVQRAAVGGTLQLTSRDAMSSRLRFVDVGAASRVRAMVSFTDEGQVVPTSSASQTPGLIEVRDDLHPWVRAYVAIAPHPFVMVTSPTGTFAFGGVPEGTYTLVVWQEQLGTRFQTVRVTQGVETRVRMEYD
jgi:hypothetical protein